MCSILKHFCKKSLRMEIEYVLPVRKGGLGNQMFQVAAAIVYQQEKGKTVLIPREFYNSHNDKNQEYADTVFRSFPNRTDVVLDQMMIDKFLSWSFTQHPDEVGFQKWEPLDIKGNVLLHGYFQYYPVMAPHETIIRHSFLSGLKALVTEYKPLPSVVGIHIRRGDYFQPPHCDFMPVQPLSYYETALEYFNKEETTFFIFSDDLDWCKKQSLFQSLPNKVFIDEPDECKTLTIMTLCHGGFICANSTFSWWGAFLGAYSLRNPIVAPVDWFRGPKVSIFPKGWICL